MQIVPRGGSRPFSGDAAFLPPLWVPFSPPVWQALVPSSGEPLAGLKRHPFPPTFPSQHSSVKPKNKSSVSLWIAREDLSSHLASLRLWTWIGNWLMQNQPRLNSCLEHGSLSHLGVCFWFYYFLVHFTARLCSSYLNFFFPLCHFLEAFR